MEIFTTNKKINVLIVDDSSFVQQMLKIALETDPEIGVVGLANNGKEAIELVERLKPNIVTMDVQMPEMDGLEATKQIMIHNPCPILVITSLNPQELLINSFDLIGAGAMDIIEKPYKDKDVIHKIKLLSEVKVVSRRLLHNRRNKHLTEGKSNNKEIKILTKCIDTARMIKYPKIIGIAASTGGPHALLDLLSGLPVNFPVPILIVQHMTDGFMGGFVNWLGGYCQLKIQEAKWGEIVNPGCVYLAPSRSHMLLGSNHSIILDRSEPLNSHRPSADLLLESIAQHAGKNSIGIILTGMGEDGIKGMAAIRKQGGYTIAQDEASCVIFGMPRAAIAKGIVDYIEPISLMSRRLVELWG
ncbi:MAG: chemotaxis-specific protein-glutamate methyltransferase CheB, partial [bacterium]